MGQTRVSHHSVDFGASIPDSAHVAGTTFSCALIENDCKLHLVPGLELQAILHLFDVEEQPLALTHLVRNEAKLGGKTKGMSSCHVQSKGLRTLVAVRTRPHLVLDALHQSQALRDHVTSHLLPSLGNCAKLKLDQLSFLQTVRLAYHPHDSKGVILAFTGT